MLQNKSWENEDSKVALRINTTKPILLELTKSGLLVGGTFEFWAIFALVLLPVAILPLLSYQVLPLKVLPFREHPTKHETENQSTVWDARPSENAKAYLKEGSMLEIYSISSSIRGDTES